MKNINDLGFEIPLEIEKYTSHSSEIAIIILNYILSVEGMNKKKFAELMGKTASDVTRWLSGRHNFTILTLSLIEAKTGLELIKSLTESEISKYIEGRVFDFKNEADIKKELNELKARFKVNLFDTTLIKYKSLQSKGSKEKLTKINTFLKPQILLGAENFNTIRIGDIEESIIHSNSDRLSLKVEDISYKKFSYGKR
jgi:transcriptional regulator with XRE-family HTH domain